MCKAQEKIGARGRTGQEKKGGKRRDDETSAREAEAGTCKGGWKKVGREEDARDNR